MATLSSARLAGLLVAATSSRLLPSPEAPKPALLNVRKIGRARAYLWTVTPDGSRAGRPLDEHKAQVILPNTGRGDRQHLEYGDCPTFLMGYSPLYGVFVFWEARLHLDSAWSKNLQVKEGLLEEAATSGWAVDAPRRTSEGREVRAAVQPVHVVRFMRAAIKADKLGLQGVDRQSFLSALAPGMNLYDDFEEIGSSDLAGIMLDLDEIERRKIEIVQSRFVRSKAFSKVVLEAYGHSCAICQTQMTILDGAHIVPVHDPKSCDEVWNGLALCKNHHALYDKKIMLIDNRAIVRVNPETISSLKSMGMFGGYDLLIDAYVDQRISVVPDFFGIDRRYTSLMAQGLGYVYSLSPA